MGVDGVNVAGVESLVGGDVSTSRQDTDGDLICCVRNKNNGAEGDQERDCFHLCLADSDKSKLRVSSAYSICEMS